MKEVPRQAGHDNVKEKSAEADFFVSGMNA
jgi:hypothetical protein